jgi:peptidoglycan-associated lipoprotein
LHRDNRNSFGINQSNETEIIASGGYVIFTHVKHAAADNSRDSGDPAMKNSALIIAAALLAAACSGEPVKQTPAPVTEPAPPVAAAPAPAPAPKPEARPAPEAPRAAVNPLDDPASPLAKRSIYYDFDRSDIRNEYKPMISAHADYLADHRGAKVRIEGNCDERGSREYNLALGNRRAESVKGALQLLNVNASQIDTVSWGEEKPKAPGHDEAAWAENRRSDIVYEQRQ